MSPARWQQVKELFDAVIDRAPDERARVLDEMCANDATLRREVETLLASHEYPASFMETPAIGEIAKVIINDSSDSSPKLAAGESIGHYRIIKPVGAGGMGEVYLATDVRLNRKVALKILSADTITDKNARRRFAQEARAASALNHPHIVTIYDVALDDEQNGRDFIVMEFIEGESLADKIKHAPLPATEIVNIAAQIADALDAAHAAGIVHRDIKPSNIMLTSRSIVKVLDFGLAKMNALQSTASEDSTQLQTASGAILGTVPYMSPEQALGQKTDARTDIFSFGTVLYEMLTARRPFDGNTSSEIIDRIAHAQPEAIARFNYDAPPELERITRKCLEKDCARRYQSARDLVVDLQNLQRDLSVGGRRDAVQAEVDSIRTDEARAALTNSSTRHATTISDATKVGERLGKSVDKQTKFQHRLFSRYGALALLVIIGIGVGIYLFKNRQATDAISSVAVLPLVNVGGDADAEYLSDGITETLINNLSQLPNLRVMSRNSVFRYKGHETETEAIARELGVQAVLTGRVVQRGDNLSISVELVNVRDNSQLWGQQFNRKLSDILTMQRDISREVSERLRLRLTGAEQQRLARAYTDNTEAYQLYLKGRFHWNKYTEAGFKKAIEYFNQAVEKDPNYALAYSGLSDSHAILGVEYLAPRETFPKAKAYAQKALALDDTLAEAHNSLGISKMFYDWNWTEAEKELKRAIELNPNYPDARHFYGHYLEATGRVDEAIAETRRGVELDPLSLIINAELGFAFYCAHRYDQAIEQERKTLEMDRNFIFVSVYLAQAYEQKGMSKEAITELSRARSISTDEWTVISELGCAYARSGQKAEARKIILELQGLASHEYIDPGFIAYIYADLDEKEQALEWLEKAYQARSISIVFIKTEPKFDRLRSDPRFQDLMRRVGLTP